MVQSVSVPPRPPPCQSKLGLLMRLDIFRIVLICFNLPKNRQHPSIFLAARTSYNFRYSLVKKASETKAGSVVEVQGLSFCPPLLVA
jgi:hypothetical protein